MRRALSPSMATSSPPSQKRLKIAQSDKTTVNIDASEIEHAVVEIPRSYQTELMTQAKFENLVICLPTGSGKTYIAVMLIKEMAYAVRASINDGGKRTVFLVKTVALVHQQSEYIRIHTDLTVGKYYGELKVDLWDKKKWINEFEAHQVLIFTAQVFLNLVDHNFFPLYKVNLLIFDECHHSKGENCYAALMNRHYDECHDKPRILGLTASISAKKIQPLQLRKVVKEIEQTYRARIASGSDRAESNRHGTSVRVEQIDYKPKQMNATNESLTIPFDIILSIISELEPYLEEKSAQREQIEHDLSEIMLTTDYLGENMVDYNTHSVDYTTYLQSENVNLPKLRRYLNNLLHIGQELGIYGLFLAARSLRKLLKKSQILDIITDPMDKELFDGTVRRIDCLVDDILLGLLQVNEGNTDILFSSKTLRVFERIKDDVEQDRLGRCIVFVERVDTANILSQVLTHLSGNLLPLNNRTLQIKYITGSKATFGPQKMVAKYLREVIKQFRTGEINVLVATAVVEEGIDIPKCNLIFRFNKPPNFSSYMQSKGRARAKENASYVVLMDRSDENVYIRDLQDYQSYTEIEKMLQEGFSIEADDFSDTSLNQLEPYRTKTGVVISATRAAQIISMYCGMIGNGRLCPPRILFHRTDDRTFASILSMPANCPVREDIVCENSTKKLAKFQCCLEMVELLHRRGELNEDCLPYRTRSSITIDIPIEVQLFKLCDELFEEKNDSTMERIPKQIASFPCPDDLSSTDWYLYRIKIRSETDSLGLIVPSKLNEVPSFNLYAASNEIISVDISFIRKIDDMKHRIELERFCRYLFENVFYGITNNSESILKFDMERSSYKLFPCLLKDVDEIDIERMLSICDRLNKPVEQLSDISDSELYVASHLSNKLFYSKIPGASSPKRTSDPWAHKKKLESIKTYADYFEDKVPNVHIERDALMATLKMCNRGRIDYIHPSLSAANKQDPSSGSQPVYFPIELLRYAPVNRQDFELFQKLPSVLARISQLYYIERLRSSFAFNINNYLLLDVSQTPRSVHFTDCLKLMNVSSNESLSPPQRAIFPLIPLVYDSLTLTNDSNNQQPLPDILFQAVTRRSSGEQMDLENLEVLGDCFLKLAVSLCLYYRYPLRGAGFLTVAKTKQISNENLYRLAVLHKLNLYLNAQKIVFRGKDANWLPPGYSIVNTQTKAEDRYTHHNAKRKAFSDMMEAFIGAYLVCSDYTTTVKLMHWLGLDVIPLDDQGHPMKLPSILRGSTSENTNDQINPLLGRFFAEQNFKEVEVKINYVFQNKAYLIAAFTHPSNFSNRVTDCYERLEFLGDAILDFLVTRHMFVNYNQRVTPGWVTDIRQDLSNNGRLAYILVACNLQTKILANSPDLFGHISSYAGDEALFPKGQSTEQYLSQDLDQWADTTAPKALADVFEALVGAVFLDSGSSLEVVWGVFEPLLRNYIDRSFTQTNLNPIRSFSEKGGRVIAETPDMNGDRSIVVCTVQLPNGTLFKGRGTNKKLAKTDACRKAMKDQSSP